MADEAIFIQGQSFQVNLSGLDARHPTVYSRRLLIFRCTSSTQYETQLAALKAGLQTLVLRCPILGGIIVPLPPDEAKDGKDDWRTIKPDKGIEFITRDLRKSLAPFEELEETGFPPHKLPYDLLMPVPQDMDNVSPLAAFKVQFSKIDGGTILTWAMSHSVADGVGTNALMRVLSEETRNVQEQSSAHPTKEAQAAADMGLDRKVMLNLKGEMPFNIDDHPAYLWKSTHPANDTQPEQAPHHPFVATSPELPVLLRISTAKLAQLKGDATTPGAPPISTHDALGALIWRSVLLIRSRRSSPTLPASTKGSIFMPSDARRHLKLPQTYIGNCVYQLTASLDLGTLFSPSGMQHAASALRRAIKDVTPALVTSLLAKTNEEWINWQFLETASTTGVAMGTDWTSTELYSHDWGKAFGPLVTYRSPGEEGGGCYILPKLPNGGAEVVVGVMKDEVEVLRGGECFGKYIEAR